MDVARFEASFSSIHSGSLINDVQFKERRGGGLMLCDTEEIKFK